MTALMTYAVMYLHVLIWLCTICMYCYAYVLYACTVVRMCYIHELLCLCALEIPDEHRQAVLL